MGIHDCSTSIIHDDYTFFHLCNLFFIEHAGPNRILRNCISEDSGKEQECDEWKPNFLSKRNIDHCDITLWKHGIQVPFQFGPNFFLMLWVYLNSVMVEQVKG